MPMDTDHALLIYCAKPELTVDFDLPPGTFARIGGSDEAEITLPLPGLDDFCGRLAPVQLRRSATRETVRSGQQGAQNREIPSG